MNQRKIGTLSLSCMLIGAILGSGIIILPPLALEAAGPWAIAGWVLTAIFGLAFGYTFAHVGTLFPGEGGAASAVEHAFGPAAKRLAAYTLACATLFGPAAVMLTIVDYLPPALMPETTMGKGLLTAALQIGSAGLIVSGLKNMSRVGVILAVSATLLLLVGSSVTLLTSAAPPAPLPEFDGGAMGYTLLLLFWAVVGWEIVGNYGAEVHNPQRTIPRAAIMAAIVIGLIFVAVGSGLQYGVFPPEAGHGVTALLYPLFGAYATWVMAGLTAALCITTYLMFVGGVARMVAHVSQDGGLPRIFDRRNRHGVPWVVMGAYTAAHLLQIFLASHDILDVAKILAISDGFFLANALLGTMAAARLFNRPAPRAVAWLLSIGVFAVLMQSHWQVLVTIGCMAFLVTWRIRRKASVGA